MTINIITLQGLEVKVYCVICYYVFQYLYGSTKTLKLYNCVMAVATFCFVIGNGFG